MIGFINVFKPKEYRSVVTTSNGSTIYGGLQVLNTVKYDSTYFPGHSGHGSDELGDFIIESVTDTVRNVDGSVSYKYNNKYFDFTVQFDCKIDDIEGGAGSGYCDYDVIEGADAKGGFIKGGSA